MHLPERFTRDFWPVVTWLLPQSPARPPILASESESQETESSLGKLLSLSCDDDFLNDFWLRCATDSPGRSSGGLFAWHSLPPWSCRVMCAAEEPLLHAAPWVSFYLFFATPTPLDTLTHTQDTSSSTGTNTGAHTLNNINKIQNIFQGCGRPVFFNAILHDCEIQLKHKIFAKRVFDKWKKNDNPHKGNNKAKQPSKPNRSNCKLQCLLRLKPLAKKAKTQQHRNSINTKQQLTYIFRQVKHGRLYYVYDVSAWVSVCVCVLVWCRTNWYATLFLPLSCHAFLWLVIMVSLFYMPFAMSSSLCVLWECVSPPIFPPTLSSQFLRRRREQARN